MNDINVLEELGLEEVSRKTHIETKTLEHMVNKEFSKLNRINTLGFIKILRREYNLDLQEWVDEFEEFLGTKEQETTYNETVLAQNVEPEQSKGWLYFLLLFLVLLGAGFWYFDGMRYFNQLKENFFEKNTSTFTQAPVIEEAEKKLEALGETKLPIETNEILTLDSNTEKNTKIIQEPQEESEKKSTNNSSIITLEPIEQKLKDSEVLEDNTTTNEVENIEILNIETIQNTQEEAAQDETTPPEIKLEEEKEEEPLQEVKESIEELTIKPNKKIWIGAINLTTKKRKTSLQDNDIKLDTKDPQILIVGHGDFVFDLGNGKIQKSSSKQKSYYHITNEEIKNITKEDFMRLNGGKSW